MMPLSHVSPVKRVGHRGGHQRTPSGFTFISMDDSLDAALGDSVVDVGLGAGARGTWAMVQVQGEECPRKVWHWMQACGSACVGVQV